MGEKIIKLANPEDLASYETYEAFIGHLLMELTITAEEAVAALDNFPLKAA